MSVFVLVTLSTSPGQEYDQEKLEKLYGEHADMEAFQKSFDEALESGIPRQVGLEAKFVFLNEREDRKGLGDAVAEFEAALKTYKPGEGFITTTNDEWAGLVSYCKALKAQLANDEAGFKKHISEAFWLNPQQGGIFGEVILAHKNKMAMATAVVDLALEIENSAKEKTSLGSLMKDKKAVLIDFWATWCGPCMERMPELQKMSDALAAHGVVVAGMNSEDAQSGGSADVADVTLKAQKLNLPWLLEPAGTPYSKLLRIDSIPRMVLVSPDGKVLFNGHPEDPELWVALKKVDAEIEEMEKEAVKVEGEEN